MDAAVLATLPLFSDLTEADLGVVAHHANRVMVDAGTVLMREGDRGLGVVVIVTGTARVHAEGRLLAELGPGDVIGEIGVIADKPHNATVQAITDLDVVAMFDPEFREVVGEVAAVRERVMAIIAERLARD